jgi:hypothetical protein
MKSRILSALLIILFSTACNATFEVGLEHSAAATASPLVPPTAAPVPTDTRVPPVSPGNTPSPTTPIQTDTPVPTSAPTVHTVKIFLIAIADNGQGGQPVGCGDSVVPVQVEITPTQSVLRAALEKMLSVKDQYYGESGLYNALYQSDLQVESISIVAGKASVYLTGNLIMGGECDTPRVQAQLEQTILQFPTVTETAIFLNGKPLTDALSLKG